MFLVFFNPGEGETLVGVVLRHRLRVGERPQRDDCVVFRKHRRHRVECLVEFLKCDGWLIGRLLFRRPVCVGSFRKYPNSFRGLFKVLQIFLH